MDAVGEVGGFMGWNAFCRPGSADADVFADLVNWESPEASAAGDQCFSVDNRIAPFRDQIAGMITGNPYQVG